MAIVGRHGAPKQSKMAINGPFVVIIRPSGSKLVDKGGINSGHIHGNVLAQFPGSGMANGGRHMVQKGLSAFLWLFGLFMALLDHNGHSGSGKRFQHIAPDVPGLDPTLINADSPVWSPQACLWPQKDRLWPFRPFWSPLAPPDGLLGPGKRF